MCVYICMYVCSSFSRRSIIHDLEKDTPVTVWKMEIRSLRPCRGSAARETAERGGRGEGEGERWKEKGSTGAAAPVGKRFLTAFERRETGASIPLVDLHLFFFFLSVLFFFFSFFGRSTRRRRANKRPRHSFLARETLVFPGQTRRETQTISPSVHAVNARNWNRRLKYKIFIGDVKVQKIEKFYNMACKLLFVYFTWKLFKSLKIRCFASVKYLTKIRNWSFWPFWWFQC